MGASIDDKVVAMSFEASKFEQGVNDAIRALEKLKASLHFPNAGKGFNDINSAAKGVQLNHISQAVDQVRSKLESLRLVAIGVFSQLATQAIRAGASFAKSFTLGPLIAGFHEYATNLNSIQTILANTQAQGTTLKDVNRALDELNRYSDKTIYNFGEMAKNIGTFTAAGVNLETSVSSIKGIANLAALSGSNAQQASTAMYQLSQAIASGRVSLQDWNSVVNAGMGGATFQKALAQTAVSMGQLKDGAVKMVGPMKTLKINGESFRESIGGQGPKWLTSDILTRTLTQFTGELTNAQLKAQGFNDAQIKAIQATAKTAQEAATKVKTLSQVLDVARETAGSGWAQTWRLIFGDFEEARSTFTNLSNTINGFINKNAEARNKILSDWKALGGRTVLINSIKTAFHNLGMVLAPIKDAFRDIFPARTGKQLYDLTLRFQEFAKSLKPSANTVENLRRTFRGLFALLDIGKQLISGIFTVFGELFGVVGEGSGSFLNFTGSIGDFLVAVDNALKKGNRLHNFFVGLGRILAAPLQAINALANAISDLFSGFSPGGFSDQLGGMTHALTPLQRIVKGVSRAWKAFIDTLSGSGNVIQPVLQAIVNGIKEFGPALGQALAGVNWEAVFAALQTGLFAGLVLMFKQFLGRGSFVNQIGKGFAGGIIKNITGSFSALQGSMVAMQNNIKAQTLKQIAIAIALLTASVVALSFVDPERLKSSLTAMAVAFGELLGAMAILGNISKTVGFIKLPVIAGSLILLAGAIDILSIAVLALSRLSWEDLAKGLSGVGALLVGLVAVSGPLSANSAGMVRAGVGITAMAVGIRILANAVSAFADMNWTTMARGIAGVAGSLVVIAGAVQLMPKGMALQGAGLIAVAAGLKILASAVGSFADLDWHEMGRGLAGVAGSLVIIAGAMHLMPASTIVIGAGLLVVALALGRIAKAVESMGGMSINQIAKGLGTLAGSLGILAAALYLMQGSIGGAIALGIAAAGLAALAPALALLGRQSWGQILKGLVTLAGALTILGVAGALLTPTIPSLLGLGAALVLIGGGLALAGAGIALIGVGLSAIAVAGPVAIGILVGALTQLTEALPNMVKNVVLGLLEMVKALANTAPQFVDALIKILDSLLDVIIKSSPKIAEAFNVLLNTALNVLTQNQGRVIQAGFNLLVALLTGIRNNISQLVTLVIDIVNRFIQTVSANISRITASGLNLLSQFVRGILSGIGQVISSVLTIIAQFVSSIASNLGKIATAGLSVLTRFLQAIASNLGQVIKAGTDVIIAFVEGVGNAGGRIVTSAVNSITKFINAVAKASVQMIDAGMKAIIYFLNGVADAINANAPEMRMAGSRVGVAIVDGMTFGLISKAQGLYNQISSIMNHAMSLMHKIPGVKSPSTVTYSIGEYIIEGLTNGMDDNAHHAYSSAAAMANGVITAVSSTLQITSPSKVMIQLGRYVGEGFAEGIRGSKEDINKAFTELNNKLTDAMVKARETIASEQEKLDKLRASKKLDKEAIAEAQRVISENEALLARSTAGHIALTKTLRDEKAELIKLTDDYEKVGEKLKKANEVLKDAKKARDDAEKSFQGQYATLPDLKFVDSDGNPIDPATVVSTYLADLKGQTAAVGAYNSTLQQLRQLGLDDATYEKLLREGTADQSFANQLLAGGKTAVESLNVLDRELMNVSQTLASNAARNLYQAGVDSAQGLVNGLASKQSAIRRQMEAIANEMIQTLKRKLKIKSPSQEFAEIGTFAMKGMAQGFTTSTNIVTDAVDQAAQEAMNQMRKTMSDMSTVVTDEFSANPVITPVLDLTQVRAQSQELNALTSPLAASTSYGQASMISSEQNATQAEETNVAPGGTSVKFEQNNYSPSALSEIDIYRQTKNQLSQLKSVLAV